MSKEKKRLKDYSKIKENQEKFLDKVFTFPEYTVKKCMEMGGLTVEKDTVVVKDKAAGCDEPPMYEFFRDYDFEEDE